MSTAPKAKTKAGHPIPPWLWALGVSLPTLFVGFLVYITTLIPDPDGRPIATKKQEALTKPLITFYQDLVDKPIPKNPEVPVENLTPALRPAPSLKPIETASNKPKPVEELGKQAPEKPSVKRAAILQVASFRNWKEADRKRAELALLGFRADIEKTRMENKDTWYRVVLGPFDDKDNLEETQLALSKYKINSLVRTQ